MTNEKISIHSIPVLKKLAEKDDNNLVRASAISLLGNLKQADNISLFELSLKKESYALQGASLIAIGLIDSMKGLKLAKLYESTTKSKFQMLSCLYIQPMEETGNGATYMICSNR